MTRTPRSRPAAHVPDEELDEAADRALHITLTDLQREASSAVVNGHDTLVVSPTGSGKSAVYQLAGAMLDGITIVVSPLVALQEDQVANFDDLEAGRAIALNALRGQRARRAALESIMCGDAQFVLLGPEQLRSPEVLTTLRERTIDRFVVDEAHCIDCWGPDFRPDFLALRSVRRSLGNTPVLALTATAAPHVREEIIAALGMTDPQVIVGDPERKNIRIAVRRHPDRETAVEALREEVEATSGTGIVYVGTRRDTTEIADGLRTSRRDALAYHGSMSAKQRTEVHRRLRSGDDVVIVATSAFGLGVDAPHVRFVLHLDPPETVDSYYQEIGRAGRDGSPASATLHAVTGRAGSRRFAAGTSTPNIGLLDAVAELDEPASCADLTVRFAVGQGRLMQAVAMLESLGIVELHDGQVVHPKDADWHAVRDAAIERIEQRATLLRTRRDMMQTIVESDLCRWSMLVGYLGSPTIGSCGHCDNCADDSVGRAPVEQPVDIEHKTFGRGTLVSEGEDQIVVLFEEHGYRTLSREVLEEQELLV